MEGKGRTEAHARDSEVTALVLQTPAGHGACFVISPTDVDACQFNATAPAPLVCFVSFERASVVAIYIEALSESDTCIRMNRKPYWPYSMRGDDAYRRKVHKSVNIDIDTVTSVPSPLKSNQKGTLLLVTDLAVTVDILETNRTNIDMTVR